MHKDEHGHHATSQTGYEVSDIHIKAVLITGLCVVVMTALAYVVGTFTVKYLRARPALGDYKPTPVALEELNKPWNLPTRLQVDAPRALGEFRTGQNAANSFGVVSEQPEIYRIPVEKAMEIVAKNGLPKFPKLAAMPAAEGQTGK